jgi:HEPN domain-containing protein
VSQLRSSNGDDHPDAAEKHLLDAGALLAEQRFDGTAYLSGYVVECALKSLLVLETGQAPGIHSLASLASQVSAVATVAGAKSARYWGRATNGVLKAAIAAWRPEMRYRGPFISRGDAQAWHAHANDVFRETVHQMKLDGVA